MRADLAVALRTVRARALSSIAAFGLTMATVAAAPTPVDAQTSGPVLGQQIASVATVARPAGRSAEPTTTDACAAGVDGSGCVVVLIDHLRRMRFNGPIKTVLVGNPAIADVTMISAAEGVISARSVGSTNMIFLDTAGVAVGDFQVLVREVETQRVVIRRGPQVVEAYQCAPRCERTLSQSDTAEKHGELLQTILSESSLNATAAASGVAE